MNLNQDRVINPIYRGVKRGIQVALENQCWGSAVTLIFCGIDMLVHLGRPEGQAEVTTEDFEAWVDRHIVIDSPTRITPGEFYSARCAVVHTYGVESRRTKGGRARRIAFVVHEGRPIVYNETLHPDFLLLDVPSFADAFFRGMDRFLIEIFADPTRKKLVEPRLEELLNAMPYDEAAVDQ